MRRPEFVFELPGAVEGGMIRGELTLPRLQGEGPFPWVLQAHGYTGSKDWGPHRLLADRLARIGIASIRFDFSGDGRAADGTVDLEVVARNVYSAEIEDMHLVRAWGDERPELDAKRRGFVGHSRGGGLGFVHVEESGDYATAVGWASMDGVLNFSQERLENWRREGFVELRHHSLGHDVRLGTGLLDDAAKYGDRYDVCRAIGTLGFPILICHGVRDHALGPDVAERLFNASNAAGTRLRWIADAGHAFGGREDQDEVPSRLTALLDETESWLVDKLIGFPGD